MNISVLKEKLKNYGKPPVDKIATNPEYQVAIDRLEQLSKQRDMLQSQLDRVNIDIDMILAMIGANEEKKQLDKGVLK